MNQCKTSLVFCPCKHHNVPDMCHAALKEYFNIIIGNDVVYICPGCKKLEFGNYLKFFNDHSHHFGFLSNADRFKVKSKGTINI